MPDTAIRQTTKAGWALPRGWVVLGGAIVSWLLVALVWNGLSQVFNVVAAAI